MSLIKLFMVTLIITCALGRKSEEVRSKARTPSTTRLPSSDVVVEKFVETLMTKDRYLQQIDTVERKLNHLDATFHEKVNSIMKYLTEILRMLKISPAEIVERALGEMKQDLDRLKHSVTTRLDEHPSMRGDTSDRLMTIESNVKSILAGMDMIVTTMSEVKSRQSSKPYVRTDSSVSDSMSVINEFRKLLHEQRPGSCESTCNIDPMNVLAPEYQDGRIMKESAEYVTIGRDVGPFIDFRLRASKNVLAPDYQDGRLMKNKGGRVDRSERYPTDCLEIQKQGFNVSGIYKIRPDDMAPFYVLCDLTTIGGGWTVFQNRYDGSQDFYKGWSDYKYGFGNLAGEFWLGLEKLSYLTNQKLYELRVEVETQHGQEAYAGYSVFTLGPEHEGFRISTLGTYYGTAGDSLSYHSGQKFSTPDVDNDDWKDGSCAAEHGGAWWYKECDKSNLNGKFVAVGEDAKGQSVYWISFKGPNTPLSKTKMMIRPLPATRPAVYNDRKFLESSKIRTVSEKLRNKDLKGNYDMKLPQFRYEDPGQAEAFFPNYGRQ